MLTLMLNSYVYILWRGAVSVCLSCISHAASRIPGKQIHFNSPIAKTICIWQNL